MHGHELALEVRGELGDLDARLAADARDLVAVGLRLAPPSRGRRGARPRSGSGCPCSRGTAAHAGDRGKRVERGLVARELGQEDRRPLHRLHGVIKADTAPPYPRGPPRLPAGEQAGHAADAPSARQHRAGRRAGRRRRSRRACPVAQTAGTAARGAPDAHNLLRMRISAKVDYALRACTELAVAAEGPTKGDRIAAAQCDSHQVPGEHPLGAPERGHRRDAARRRGRLLAGASPPTRSRWPK